MKKAIFGLVLAIGFFAAFPRCTPAQRDGSKEKKPLPTSAAPPPAQQNEVPVAPCPTIELRAPQRPVRDGEQVAFVANLNGGDPKVVPILIWSISAGTMIGGQGTRNIGVDSTGAGADKAITATIQIGGYAPECTADATTTVTVAGPAKKLDEYAVLAETDELQRLDAFNSNVTEKEMAYVIAYAGRTSPRGQANSDLKRIKAYLTKIGAPNARIVTVDGGYREEISHELWLVPIGAEAPKATPTIAAKDIVFPKPTPVVKKP